MKQKIQIRCKNNKKTQKVEIGSTLFDVFSSFDLKMTHGPVSARVNNKVEGMHYRVYNSKDVEFLDMNSASGSRAYTRTLFFVLCKAVQDIYPNTDVVIDIPVSNGFYVDIRLGRPVVDEEQGAIIIIHIFTDFAFLSFFIIFSRCLPRRLSPSSRKRAMWRR